MEIGSFGFHDSDCDINKKFSLLISAIIDYELYFDDLFQNKMPDFQVFEDLKCPTTY